MASFKENWFEDITGRIIHFYDFRCWCKPSYRFSETVANVYAFCTFGFANCGWRKEIPSHIFISIQICISPMVFQTLTVSEWTQILSIWVTQKGIHQFRYFWKSELHILAFNRKLREISQHLLKCVKGNPVLSCIWHPNVQLGNMNSLCGLFFHEY